MKRHPTVAATLAFLFLLVWQARADENLPKLVKKIQPAVVTVIAYDASGRVKGQGSGFFINRDGQFVTNYHVLAGAARAEVKDLAGCLNPVIKITAKDRDGDLIVAVSGFNWSDENLERVAAGQGIRSLKISAVLPEVGERVVVVGSPMGLEQTLSDGVVSAVRWVKGLGEILQITAPISPGSSGSPVVNMKGEVVGVATFLFKDGQNLNFAVPGNRVLALQQRAAKPTTGQKPDLNSYSDEELTKTVGDKILPLPFNSKKPDLSTEQPHGPAKVFYEKAEIFLKDRHYKKAAVAYREAIRFQPDYVDAYIKLGCMYLLLHSFDEAVTAFKQAVHLKSSAEAYNGLGEAYESLSRYQEALAAYKQAIRLKPDYAGAHFNLGTFYLSMGNKSGAIEEYKGYRNYKITVLG